MQTETKTHRFKVTETIFFEEEVFTITQLTSVNGWPAYFVKEVSYMIFDNQCSIPPVPVTE
jgi:hypothetical protein